MQNILKSLRGVGDEGVKKAVESNDRTVLDQLERIRLIRYDQFVKVLRKVWSDSDGLTDDEIHRIASMSGGETGKLFWCAFSAAGVEDMLGVNHFKGDAVDLPFS